MDTHIACCLNVKYALGDLLAQGKTKKMYGVKERSDLAILVSKDDITAGDGAKHAVLEGKAILANETTCNVFSLLKTCGVPLAFEEQNSMTSFVAKKCDMLPYEVVVRREAHGSYVKRNPHLKKRHLFPQILVEFFLKTSNRAWRHYPLPCDDPLMMYDYDADTTITLYHPSQPIYDQKPLFSLDESEVFAHEDEGKHFYAMEHIARKVFLILEKAWQIEGATLVDMKVEFGCTEGALLLADVIDNDSWRVIEHSAYIDKQLYRDGETLEAVFESYARVAQMTRNFRIPRQQIILWRGSPRDDFQKFINALGRFPDLFSVAVVTCSTHKEPERAVRAFSQLIHDIPDAVVIAYIGKSNGAGPTLSALSTIPVITVPANLQEFKEDLWSSVRTPRDAPVMTILEPENAVLAALQILSARNPHIYAHLREDVETRRVNI